MCDWRFRKMRATIDNRLKRGLGAEFAEQDNAVLKAASGQLDEYFGQQRTVFTMPLLVVGTEFQKTVWKALMLVPFATSLSYLELAEKINNKKAVRAVASANGANALSIFIPCHRIIGSNGELVGYAGGLAAKKRLLKLEQRK